MSEFLQDMLNRAEKEAEGLNDKGHQALILDLENILKEAKQGKFHDFHKEGYDAPKVSLASNLEALKQNVITGIYDN